MDQNPAADISRLISSWQSGDRAVEAALFEAMYRALHGIASKCLQHERPGHSLGATALVHEAYLRFRRSQNLTLNDRSHFLALAARVMRRILVDRARSPRIRAVGGVLTEGDSFWNLIGSDVEADKILEIDAALEDLSHISPRQAKLVELRYFGGYTIEESAVILQVSYKTAQRDWNLARARLKLAIHGETSPTA